MKSPIPNTKTYIKRLQDKNWELKKEVKRIMQERDTYKDALDTMTAVSNARNA